MPNRDVTDYLNGVAILLDNINPPQTVKDLETRIAAERQRPEWDKVPARQFAIIPVLAVAGSTTQPESGSATAAAAVKTVEAQEDDKRPLTRAVVVSVDPAEPYDASAAIWQEKLAATEWQILQGALNSESKFTGVTSFDAVVASQAKLQALLAIMLSLILIVIYVWVRFGGLRYGLGAIFSLVHDAVVALAATVLAKYLAETWLGAHLLISDFKINLTMIAAYLTIIGYSVNDTIVIFDRVRELRGRGQQALTAKLVNDAINQCFGRTIWTTFTVFIVVLVMYIFGGEGVRGFSFAMLIGVITGAYSTLAIASPMLLTVRETKKKGAPPSNPFLQRIEQLPTKGE
jgi:SecD/SecF fusion protein